MDWRIRQNGWAHAPKWIRACMIHYTCVYIRMGWGLLRRGPPGSHPPWRSRHQPGSRAAKVSSPLEYTHMYSVSCMRRSILANAPIHFGECASPFYRMRQSILANASVHFIECASPFYRMRQSILSNAPVHDCFVIFG